MATSSASKNEFSSFEYIQPADYLPSFDQTANLDAWDNAAAQERANAEIRSQEAQQWEKTIGQAQKLSVTLAEEYKRQRDQNDIARRNQARELEQEMLAKGYDFSYKKMAEYYANDDAHNKDTGYYDSLAAQVQETDPELAQKLRSLTGRKGKMMNQVLVMSAANSYEGDFYATVGEISIERDDGTVLTWDNASTTPERRMIQARWREEKGLNINDIGGFNAEFLRDNYYSTIDKTNERILREASLTQKEAIEADELAQETEVLKQAALRNDTSLGRAVESFINSNPGKYGSPAGARRKARDILLNLVKTGQISVENFKSIYQHKFPHNGTNKEEDFSVWKEFNLEKDSELDGLLQAAEAAGALQYEQGRAVEANRYVMEIDRQIEEQGRPPTEAEAAQALQIFEQKFPGYKVPERLRTLHTRTLEDTEDNAIIADIRDKLDRGIALGDEYKRIKDPTKYAEYQKITASDLGQGLDPSGASEDRKYITSLIKDSLEMTMGVGDTDTPEFLTMKGNAERLYAKSYREAQFHTPAEKRQYAIQQVEKALAHNNGSLLKVRPSVSSAQSYALKRDTALTAISEGGAGVVRRGILPGTEEDFKLLEAYAKDPSTGAIPPIYGVLARDMNKPGYNAFDLANEQYKAVTGKDLPKVPTHVDRLRKSSPFVQRLMTYKGSSRANVQQASIIEKGNGNFNIQEAILPGLQLEAVG